MGKGRSNPVPEVDVEDDFDKESGKHQSYLINKFI
jgi:hypothetical protein